MKKSSSKFALEDLPGYISGVATKQENPTFSISKPRAPTLRSSKQTPKKRKTVDRSEAEVFEDLTVVEMIKKLSGLCNLGLEKVAEEVSKVEADYTETIQDLKRLAELRIESNAKMEEEMKMLRAELKEIQVVTDLNMQEAVEETKRSVATAILESKVEMAKEAADDGFSAAAWTESLQKGHTPTDGGIRRGAIATVQ